MLKQRSLTPKLVVDVCVFTQRAVLLVRYKDLGKYDGQKGWFLPDDFLEFGEHPSQAAQRILREQVGQKRTHLSLSFIESFGTEAGGKWHLIFHYEAKLPDVFKIKPMPNVIEAQWFSLNDLPEADMVAHDGWALNTIREIMELSKSS